MDKKKKILVADDDKLTREMLGLTLINAGYEVIFAEDGLAAVEKASTEKPDLVLMDGLMPKMHGFLACKTIKQLDAPPKVLLLTGIYTKPTYQWEVKSQYLGDGLLSKPFDRATLLSAIEKLLDSPTVEEAPSAQTAIANPEEAFQVATADEDSETGFAISRARTEGAPIRENAQAIQMHSLKKLESVLSPPPKRSRHPVYRPSNRGGPPK
jgi:CheY-like chemotaxis protein